MGSVSSLNPGVANLLQSLSNVDSPVLSSPTAVSALENAPASDIVQLSMSATQLENVDLLFGLQNSTTASAGDNLIGVLESLASSQESSATTAETSAEASGTSTATSTASEAGQVASTQAALASEEAAALFGTGSSTSSSNASLLSLIG